MVEGVSWGAKASMTGKTGNLGVSFGKLTPVRWPCKWLVRRPEKKRLRASVKVKSLKRMQNAHNSNFFLAFSAQ
jgi:hypothetical protein